MMMLMQSSGWRTRQTELTCVCVCGWQGKRKRSRPSTATSTPVKDCGSDASVPAPTKECEESHTEEEMSQPAAIDTCEAKRVEECNATDSSTADAAATAAALQPAVKPSKTSKERSERKRERRKERKSESGSPAVQTPDRASPVCNGTAADDMNVCKYVTFLRFALHCSFQQILTAWHFGNLKNFIACVYGCFLYQIIITHQILQVNGMMIVLIRGSCIMVEIHYFDINEKYVRWPGQFLLRVDLDWPCYTICFVWPVNSEWQVTWISNLVEIVCFPCACNWHSYLGQRGQTLQYTGWLKFWIDVNLAATLTVTARAVATRYGGFYRF